LHARFTLVGHSRVFVDFYRDVLAATIAFLFSIADSPMYCEFSRRIFSPVTCFTAVTPTVHF